MCDKRLRGHLCCAHWSCHSSPPSPNPTLQMLNQMTRAAITHAHVCHLIKIPPSELCLQLPQRRWCVISAERRSPPRMLWRPTGKLTQVLCRHVCAHSGCAHTKFNAATKTQHFPINFQSDPQWSCWIQTGRAAEAEPGLTF